MVGVTMTKQLCVVIALYLANGASAAAELKTYRCNYERYANGEKIQEVEKPFELIFVADPSGRVTLIGNQGSSEVMGVWNKAGEGVSFIEVTAAGNVMTTVVDSKGATVHSRHTIINGEAVPSQFYGHCEVQ